MEEPVIKIKDRHLVEIVYPSGRVVRYLYNHILSELQPVLIKEEVISGQENRTYALRTQQAV